MKNRNSLCQRRSATAIVYYRFVPLYDARRYLFTGWYITSVWEKANFIPKSLAEIARWIQRYPLFSRLIICSTEHRRTQWVCYGTLCGKVDAPVLSIVYEGFRGGQYDWRFLTTASFNSLRRHYSCQVMLKKVFLTQAFAWDSARAASR